MDEDRSRFSAATELHGDTATVFAMGELDLATAPLLASVLADAIARRDVGNVSVDLLGVTFADSTALQILILAARRARGLGMRFDVCTSSEPVRKLLQVTALEGYFSPR